MNVRVGNEAFLFTDDLSMLYVFYNITIRVRILIVFFSIATFLSTKFAYMELEVGLYSPNRWKVWFVAKKA